MRTARILAPAAIVLAGLLAYASAFPGAFVFDDAPNVARNAQLDDPLSYLPGGTGHAAQPNRSFTFLTFALDRAVAGNDPSFHRGTNVAIHLASALLVLALAVTAFRTPRLRRSALAPSAWAVGLAAGLLFVTHPIQTQAVTYVVQRLASLATLLYLLAAVLYLRWRLAREEGREASAPGRPTRARSWPRSSPCARRRLPSRSPWRSSCSRPSSSTDPGAGGSPASPPSRPRWCSSRPRSSSRPRRRRSGEPRRADPRADRDVPARLPPHAGHRRGALPRARRLPVGPDHRPRRDAPHLPRRPRRAGGGRSSSPSSGSRSSFSRRPPRAARAPSSRRCAWSRSGSSGSSSASRWSRASSPSSTSCTSTGSTSPSPGSPSRSPPARRSAPGGSPRGRSPPGPRRRASSSPPFSAPSPGGGTRPGGARWPSGPTPSPTRPGRRGPATTWASPSPAPGAAPRPCRSCRTRCGSIPAYALGHESLGVALADAGRTAEAEAIYRKAIELDPKLAEPWFDLGTLRFDAGRYAEAAPYFERAIAIRRAYPEAWANLAACWNGMGRPDEVIRLLGGATDVIRGYPLARAQLALAQVQVGDLPAARREVEAIRARAPGIAAQVQAYIDARGRPPRSIPQHPHGEPMHLVLASLTLALAASPAAPPAVAAPAPAAAPNPLLAEWRTPFGLPPFDRDRAGPLPARRSRPPWRRSGAEVEAIATNPAPPTFENTVAALDAVRRAAHPRPGGLRHAGRRRRPTRRSRPSNREMAPRLTAPPRRHPARRPRSSAG